MTCYFGKLITRYNSARDHITLLLASELEVSDHDIAEADQKLSDAFDAIMQAEARTPLQAFARIRFIVEQINQRSEDQEIIKKMTSQILDDISEISAETYPEHQNMLTRAV